MLIAIILYIIILFGIGIFDFFKVKNFEDYAVAGKNQSFHRVFLSLMATMIGASATIGIVDRTVLIGFPAFWWLAVGSMGLILQAVLLSEKIRNLDADTLPDVAEKTVGSMGRILLAIIISISWIGVIAAQFVSIVKIVSVVVPDASKNIILVIISLTLPCEIMLKLSFAIPVSRNKSVTSFSLHFSSFIEYSFVPSLYTLLLIATSS